MATPAKASGPRAASASPVRRRDTLGEEHARRMPADGPPPESQHVVVNGLRLHYLDWGGDARRTVLAVHGLLGEAHTWDVVARSLRDRYRILALDLRGHGDSDWAKDGYPLTAFVSDIHGFVERLGLEPFDYVGHSLGVRIGIAYAGEHTGTLRRVVFSDGGPQVTRAGAMATRELIQTTLSVRGFRSEGDAREHYRKQFPGWLPEFHEIHARNELRLNWAGRLVFKADPELQWITGSASLGDVPYLWEMASRISVPTLLLAGAKSPVLDDELIARMQQAMPMLTVVRLPTGHHTLREDPAAFSRALDTFLSG